MVSQIAKQENTYQAAFRELQSALAAFRRVPWVDRLRESAMDQFERLGFPSVKEEEWKYTNVATIAKIDFSPIVTSDGVPLSADQLELFTYPEARESRLVFVNGILRTDLSSLTGLPEGVVAIDLVEALRSDRYHQPLQEYLARIVDYGENGFTALNTAFLGHGALVWIPKGLRIDTPLHLLFASDAAQPNAASFPRVLVIGEENSSGTIIESYAGVKDQVSFTNAVVEYRMKAQALSMWRPPEPISDGTAASTQRTSRLEPSFRDTTSV